MIKSRRDCLRAGLPLSGYSWLVARNFSYIREFHTRFGVSVYPNEFFRISVSFSILCPMDLRLPLPLPVIPRENLGRGAGIKPNRVVRSASSIFQEYNIPTPNSGLSSIAADNTSAIWFTELNSNRLGEWHDGVIKEYTIPGAEISVGGKNQVQACGPTSVVPDRSNDIWVICIFSNQIDEFFPANGSFFSFNLPVFQSGPAGLVFDQYGNFWFTAADAAMLGHGIVSQLVNNTSDGITEFPPLNNSYVFNFQESTNFLGDTRNVQSSLPTPSGIALTLDGNTLWISEHVDSSFDSFNIRIAESRPILDFQDEQCIWLFRIAAQRDRRR